MDRRARRVDPEITWGHGSTTNPNRRSNEDVDPFYVNKPTGQRQLQNLYHLFTIAQHLQPDPRYAWLLSLNPQHDEPPGWFVWFPWRRSTPIRSPRRPRTAADAQRGLPGDGLGDPAGR